MSEAVEKYTNSDELPKLIESWAKSGSTNNHAELVSNLATLKRVSQSIIDSGVHNTTFNEFYTKILDASNIKLVYRCLNLQKNNITIPTIHILSHVFTYNMSIFINAFDLTTNILPKLLLKSNQVRQEFIKFWINLNTAFGYFDRSQHFGSKIWVNIFKSLTSDSTEIITALVEFIDSKVLQEQNFKKATKLKFINEECLFNLQLVLDKFDHVSFFRKVVDVKTGILYIEPSNYTVTVNNQKFKINNKVLFNLLKFIKLDCMERINLAALVLSSDHNLINPYMNHLLINGGYHEPALTNWYLCHSLLYIKVLSFPTFDLSNILLKPLSKAVLVKGIQFSSPLVSQLNLQMVYLILKKLHHVDRAGISRVLKSLPEIADFLSVKPTNEVTRLTVFKILELYSEFQPSLNTQLNKFVGDTLNSLLSDFNKLNLIYLNLMISIQLNLSHKFELKQNSLIVKIINFSKMDNSPLFYYSMVSKLVNIPAVTLLNPLYCLIQLKHPSSFDTVIEQSLLRFNNAIYKYYDMPFAVNVFTKILIEQAHHAVKKDNTLLGYVRELVRELVYIGEDPVELKRLVDHYGLDVQTAAELKPVKIIKSDYEFLCCIYNLSLASDNAAKEEFTKLSNYAISNPNCKIHFNNDKLFKWAVGCCNSAFKLTQLNQLLTMVGFEASYEVSEFVYKSLLASSDLKMFNWLLTKEQLNSQQFAQEIQLSNFQHLLATGRVPDVEIDDLFRFESEAKYSVIRAKLNSSNIGAYIDQIFGCKKYDLLEGIDLGADSLAKITALNLSDHEKCELGAIISTKEDLSEFYSSFEVTEDLSFAKLVNLYANSIKYVNSSIDVDGLIAKAPALKDTFTPSFIEIMKHSQSPNHKWVTESMIYITKQFAELEELSSDFQTFLDKYVELFPLNIAVSVLNTQLEVLLRSKYVSTSFIHYMSKVIVAHPQIDVNKTLTIFINNPANALNELPRKHNATIRIESSLIIYNLFNMGASPQILDNLILWYNGSTLFEDVIIKKVLVKLESVNGRSWMNKKWNWEINEFHLSDFDVIGDQKLFSDGLISLNKHFIKNCVENGQAVELPDSYPQIVNSINERMYLCTYDFNDIAYDYEFLILLIINNDEFFSFGDDTKINMKNIVQYHILELLVKNFHNPISKVVLSSIIKHIDADLGFKDKTLFKIYVSNLLNSEQLKPIQLNIYAKLVAILANPGHYLYEFVYKYVLSHPKIGDTELPLFSKIKSANPRTIEWYLTGIDICTEDLPILNMNEFFEWTLNLVNLPNSRKLSKAVLKIIFKVPEINNGAVSLVTRYAILSYLEQLSQNEGLKVNVAEIGEKLSISANKRTFEWSNYDIFNSVKRLKN